MRVGDFWDVLLPNLIFKGWRDAGRYSGLAPIQRQRKG